MKRRFPISALTALTMMALISGSFRGSRPARGLRERNRYRGSAFLPEPANVQPTLRVKGPPIP